MTKSVRFRFVLRVIAAILSVLITIALVLAIRRDGPAALDAWHAADVRWTWIIISIACGLGGHAALVIGWRRLLVDIGISIGLYTITRLLLVSNLGRYLPGAKEDQPGLANDFLAVKYMLGAAVSRLQFVWRLVSFAKPTAPSTTAAQPVPDELAKSIVQMYAENARIVEALAASYGFQPIYVWQPALLSTRKPLTAREAWLRRVETDTFIRAIRDVHTIVPTLIGPAMAPVAGDRFIETTGLFNDDADEIFVDLFGHTYERANPRIVDALMPSLGAAVARAASRASLSHPATSQTTHVLKKPGRVQPGR